MKKIVYVSLLALVLFIGPSFKLAAPVPVPSPVPPYSMVDITDLNQWAIYHGYYYAIKVVFTGYLFSDNTTTHQCEYTVSNPHDSDIWNADELYWVDSGTPVYGHVYTKQYSNSSWSYLGSASTYYCSYTTSQDHCLQTLTVSIYDLQTPE